METKEDLTNCKEKILEFLSKEDKYVDYFLTFKFDDLRKRDRSYGKFRAERDEDSFWLTKYINFILYNNKLPNITSLDEMNEYYGGDTMNPLKNSEYYLTIGNFMLLPKRSINKYTTFNTFRYSCFRDDFAKFLKKIEEIYKNIDFILNDNENKEYKKWLNEDYNTVWVDLVISNEFYFKKINTYAEFLKVNLLEDFQQNNIELFIKKRSKKICEILKKI